MDKRNFEPILEELPPEFDCTKLLARKLMNRICLVMFDYVCD
jgi:hypothetical protein